MNLGKCPGCKKLIQTVKMEGITIEPSLGFTAPSYHGVSYLCPYCNVILGVSIDPIAVKTDTVRDVLSGLGRA